MTQSTTIVSAPGKVLVTGGYLVLDPNYSGLVLTTTSRFYTSMVTASTQAAANGAAAAFSVNLDSPQFHYTSQYDIFEHDNSEYELRVRCDAQGQHRNAYIEDAILFALSVAQHFLKNHAQTLKIDTRDQFKDIRVKIVADNDFYSQRETLHRLNMPISLESLEKLGKFYVAPKDQKIHKTGLGSSAALVTSLVAALLQHFGIVNLSDSSSDMAQREFIHRIAQFSHCLSQGKIGSGFDVSSATFGSQKYTRFSPQIMNALLERALRTPRHCPADLLNDLIDALELNQLLNKNLEQSRWDHKHEAFNLPPGFALFVGDVEQGSNTPLLVSNVLKWRKEKSEEANALWNHIKMLNARVEGYFSHLSELAKKDEKVYAEVLSALSTQPASEWQQAASSTQEEIRHDIINTMIELRSIFYEVRKGMKQMGQETGKHVSGDAASVPIEPDAQSALVDATMLVPGCILGGVPGAGGFDAIFCILFGGNDSDRKQVRERVTELWVNYPDARVTPLLLSESREDGLQVHESI